MGGEEWCPVFTNYFVLAILPFLTADAWAVTPPPTDGALWQERTFKIETTTNLIA